MSLVATWLLLLVVVLVMIVSAVFGYALWNIALWWLDSKNNGITTGVQGNLPQNTAPGWNDYLNVVPGGGNSGKSQPVRFDLDVRRQSSPARPVVVSLVESPSPREIHWHQNSQRARIQSGTIGSHPPSSASGPRLPVGCTEHLRRGYASQLALRFSGDLGFHTENVEAITNSFELQQADICYCFLCLEEASTGGNNLLSLKKWGTGVYAARLWAVALARFVMAAQQKSGTLEATRLEPLCAEWQYKSKHFLREVQSMEVLFQRRHGQVLMAAFQQPDIRYQEVARAVQVLCQQGQASAPQSSRLNSGGPEQPALASGVAQPIFGQTLPALPHAVPQLPSGQKLQALPDSSAGRPRLEVASPQNRGIRKRNFIAEDVNNRISSKRGRI